MEADRFQFQPLDDNDRAGPWVLALGVEGDCVMWVFDDREHAHLALMLMTKSLRDG